jgi:hypothetical protein
MGAYVFVLAVAAYANAVGNGFAYDDNLIIAVNPVVTEGRMGEAVFGPYWFGAREGAGLYRPATLGSFVAEWRLWGGSPMGFHVVSILAHALVTFVLFRLLLLWVPLMPAAAGAALFAVHPVHVEAVANVVGRSEIYAALATLCAGLVYLAPDLRVGRRRGARMGLLALLYLVGLGSKEGAVMLPAALVVLEAARRDGEPLARRLLAEAPVFLGLAGVLAGYLLIRLAVLGAVTGGAAAPELIGVTPGERLLTALTLWPEYLRLLLFPRTLSADYAPAVLLVSRQVSADVVAGAVVLGGLSILAVASMRRMPLVGAGIAWFFVTVLPVSNLLFPAGILLGERTLYLPSVGASIAVAGLLCRAGPEAPAAVRRVAFGAVAVAALALLVRTVDRNPSWFSTYTVMNTLALEHPESAAAMRTRAMGLERVGERRDAAHLWRTVVSLQPNHYGFLLEAGRFFGRQGEAATAASLMERARAVRPDDPSAYRALAGHLLRQGDGRGAHRVALAGLARAGADGALWALVSESYIAKGDLEASLRARRAALAVSPDAANFGRLADVLEALGRPDEARSARERAGAASSPPNPATLDGAP